MAQETVLVTGAAGFIASHIIHRLLQCGGDGPGNAGYCVRGTMRRQEMDTHAPMLRDMARKLGVDVEKRLQIVPAELLEDDGWAEAVEDCTYVIHTASPLPIEVPDSPEVLVEPACGGVRRVLTACASCTSVKRVVLTSSNSAISGGGEPSRSHKTVEHVFTEEDWSDPALCPPYERSKTLAEKLAWEIWSSLPEDKRFELVVVNPVLVLGPLVMNNPGASMLMITKTMSGGFPMYPQIYPTVVDVRDVAEIHVAAMTTPGISGQRFLACGEAEPVLSLPEIARLLYDTYASEGFSFSTFAMPWWLVYPMSFLIKELNFVKPFIGLKVKYDLSKSVDTFGVSYTPIRQCVLDAGKSCIEHGAVRPT